MKKLGLIGGMSWESSLEYYRQLNMGVKKALGGFHSCNCIMESVDFDEVAKLQHEGDWLKLQELMVSSARNLENAGAQLLVLCTNTMHAVSKAIEENVNIPFIHIASATGARINLLEIDNVLLLGTRFTMEQDFYKDILESDYGISVCIPAEKDRKEVHNIIYNELVKGVFNESSKTALIQIIEKNVKAGAQGVILGCTELPLLIKQEQIAVPLFDTTAIHVESALKWALT